MADVRALCCNARDAENHPRKGHRSSPSQHQFDDAYVPHDIFLSHSGAQKGFVTDLYQELRRNGFSTFFDVEHHSLPLGEHFPSRIFQAVKNCRVALVVLSEDFVYSKWPMVELRAFVDAMGGNSGRDMRLLPLFFKLFPEDLKCEKNRERWREAWRVYAEQDGKHRIDVSKWEEAVQILCSLHGIKFEQAYGGEKTYIDKIVSAIFKIVPPAFTFDSTFIAGKDRLCQVILDKLESMDRHQSNRKTMSSPECASPSTRAHSMATCSVLGLYGPPGGGKSTLCKCLVNHFPRLYDIKNTLYLELPSTPSDADVAKKLMELRHLTNFGERVGLDRISDLEHVVSLLKSCRLSSCKVFLVLDNISEKTWEAVHRILHLGFGRGSKIILVARTLEVLRKTLDALEHRLQWDCDSIAVPSIDEMEASEILLQSARGNYGAAFDKQSVTSSQMETVKRIVRMCSYGDVWLPLVMKAVGVRFFKYDKNDFEGWEKDLESLCVKVKTYKQNALIEELLGDNFKTLLDERLQVIFLDVTLFILCTENTTEHVIDALSVMHGLSKSRLEMLIQDLARLGFLNVVGEDGVVGVHDVYLEFARSIRDGPFKYITTPISWCWRECKIPEAESEGSLLLKEDESLEDKGKLRTLVLEVGESCERVDLHGFSGLKGVILRNCKSVAVLALAGLGSLTILEVRGCTSFRGVECNDIDHSSLLNIKKFVVQAQSKTAAEVDEEPGQVSYFLQPIVNGVRRVLMAPFRQPRSLGVGYNILSQMRNLQVVCLQNTGIGRLECVGGMWPQLRNLTVIEQHLERFELGCLPKLEKLHFCDVELDYVNICFIKCTKWSTFTMWRRNEGEVRHLLEGQDLLLGCPQLKQVRIESAFLEQGRLGTLPAGTKSLKLHCLETAIELPDLSSSAHTLQILDVQSCGKLERVNVDTEFQSLTQLVLFGCCNLVEVNLVGSLPRLRILQVVRCRKLQKLTGFGNSKELEELSLIELSELREVSCFSSLRESFHTLRTVCCPNLMGSSVPKADEMCDMGKPKPRLSNGEKITECAVSVDGECCFDLSSCKSLREFEMYVNEGSCDGVVFKLEGLDKLEELSVGIRLEPSKRADYEPSEAAAMCGLASVVRLGGTGSISIDLSHDFVRSKVCVELMMGPGGRVDVLNLYDSVLSNMEDVGQYLATLRQLTFHDLPNLRSLRGVEFLTRLESLYVSMCPVLEEVPSLHALVHLTELTMAICPKVKVVEGCDYMTRLEQADFTGCESMEKLPFSNLDKTTKLRELQFWGCKFASDVEAMAAWVKDESAPIILRVEAFRAALRQYYQENEKEQVANLLWWSMVRWMPLNHNGCLDFSWLERIWIDEVGMPEDKVESSLRMLVRELGHRFMERELLYPAHESHVHTSSIIQFLDEFRLKSDTSFWMHYCLEYLLGALLTKGHAL